MGRAGNWWRRWEASEQREMDALGGRVDRQPPCVVVRVRPWDSNSDASKATRLGIQIDRGEVTRLPWGYTSLPLAAGPHELVFAATGPLRSLTPWMRVAVVIEATDETPVELIYRMPTAPWRRATVGPSS